MTDITTLITRVCDCGVQLRVRDGALEASPPGALPADLRAELLAHRADVLEALSEVSVIDPESLIAGWRGAVLERGELAGWPRLAYRKPSAVAPGEYNWRLFAQQHSVEDLMLLVDATRAYLARLPLPEPDTVPPVPNSPTLDGGGPANRCADCDAFCGNGYRCSPCAARRALHPPEGTA